MSIVSSDILQPSKSPTKEYSLFGQSEVHRELSSLKRMQIEGFNTRINEKLEALDRLNLVDLVKHLRSAYPLIDKKLKDKIAQYPSVATSLTDPQPNLVNSHLVGSNVTGSKDGAIILEPLKSEPATSDCAVLEQKLAVQKQRFNTIISELTMVDSYFKGLAAVDKPLKTITLKTIYNNHLKMIAERDEQITNLKTQISNFQSQALEGLKIEKPAEDVLAKYRVEKDSLSTQATALKSQLEQSHHTCTSLKTEISQLKSQIQEISKSSQAKIDLLTISEAALAKQIGDIKSQLENASKVSKSEISQLKAELDQAKSRSVHIESQLAGLNSEIKEKESQLLAHKTIESKPEKIVPEFENTGRTGVNQSDLEKLLAAEKESHAESLKVAEQQAKIAQQKLDALRPMNKKLKEEITSLKASLKSQEEQINDLKAQAPSQATPPPERQAVHDNRDSISSEILSKLQRSEESKACLYQELKALKESHDMLRNSYEEGRSKIEASEKKSSELAIQNKSLNADLNSAKDSEGKLMLQLKDITEKFRISEKSVEQHISKIEDTSNSLATLHAQVSTMKAEIIKKDAQLSLIQKEGTHVQDELSRARQLLASMKEEYENLDSQYKQNSQRFDKLRSEYDDFKGRHQTCQPKSSELFCGNCARLQSELTKALAQIVAPAQKEEFSLSANTQIVASRNEVNKLTIENEKLKIELIKSKKSIDALQKKCSDIEDELSTFKTSHRESENPTSEKLKITSAELNNLTISHEKQKIELMKAKKSLDSQTKTVSDLQSQIDTLKTSTNTDLESISMLKSKLISLLSDSPNSHFDDSQIISVDFY